jgi:hypothetical protein
MDLRDRLKAMGVMPRSPGVPAPPAPDPAPSANGNGSPLHDDLQEYSRRLRRIEPFRKPRLTLDEAMPGNWHKTSEGDCYYVERRYAATEMRGPVALGSMLQARPSVLWEAGRATAMSSLDSRHLLFLDTETTGLSGGVGTYVFLVGVAFYSERGDEVVVRQYFLADVSAERALLHALNDLFSQFQAVITFNGKSFDWPLLETRYTFSRLRCTLKDPPHLDLLGPARRLWRDQLPSCSLETLETHVLGVRRGFDVPGWRIPSLYFQYLRVGHVGHVLPVFDHNEHDLLTLMALTGHIGRILDAPDEVDLQAAELFGLGKLYEDLGRYAESLRCYERGLTLGPSVELRGVALRRLSLLYKHLQQRDEAVAIWASLADEGTHLMFPYLELAKHYEHRAKDYEAAERYTLMAMERAFGGIERAELEHRLARVRGKAARARHALEVKS